ncbi:MAG: hypothetical protein IJV06_07525 [Bacteroidaceae bacterium]|nr:hypothetical protein [Bacteroidaceae bacterium]
MKKTYITPKMEIVLVGMNTCLCIESLNSSNPTNIPSGPTNGGNASDDDEAAAKARGFGDASFGDLW